MKNVNFTEIGINNEYKLKLKHFRFIFFLFHGEKGHFVERKLYLIRTRVATAAKGHTIRIHALYIQNII